MLSATVAPLPAGLDVPLLDSASPDAWRRVDLSEPRHSGQQPILALYHLLWIKKPTDLPYVSRQRYIRTQRQRALTGHIDLASSPSQSLCQRGSGDESELFSLPHTIIYNNDINDGLVPTDWFFSVDYRGQSQVLRKHRRGVTDMNVLIDTEFSASSHNSSGDRQSSRSSTPGTLTLAQHSANKSHRLTKCAVTSRPFLSSYTRPVTAPTPFIRAKATDAIVAQIIEVKPNNLPIIRYLNRRQLLAVLDSVKPVLPSMQPTLQNSAEYRRKQLYTELIREHPELLAVTAHLTNQSPTIADTPTDSDNHSLPQSFALLQQFTAPSSKTQCIESFRVQWMHVLENSQPVCVVHRYTNRQPYFSDSETAAPIDDRARSFDYQSLSNVQCGLMIGGLLRARLESACRTIAAHIDGVSNSALAVALMTVHFNYDSVTDRLQLLWCDKLIFQHELADNPALSDSHYHSDGQPVAREEEAKKELTLDDIDATRDLNFITQPPPQPLTSDSLTVSALTSNPTSNAHTRAGSLTSPRVLLLPAMESPRLTLNTLLSSLSKSVLADTSEDAVEMDYLEHVGPIGSWSDQAWIVIRERRTNEQKAFEDYERQVYQQLRTDKEAKEKKIKCFSKLNSPRKQHSNASTNASSVDEVKPLRKRVTTVMTARQPLPSLTLNTSLVDAQAPSQWQSRALVHEWKSSSEHADSERRLIWENKQRGRRSWLEQHKKHQIRAHASQRIQRRPPTKKSVRLADDLTEGHYYGSEFSPRYRLRSTLEASSDETDGYPRPLSLLTLHRTGRSDCCPRCGAVISNTSARSQSLTLGHLINAHERIQSIIDLSLSTVLPTIVQRLFPSMTVAEYEHYRVQPDFLASRIDLCGDCCYTSGAETQELKQFDTSDDDNDTYQARTSRSQRSTRSRSSRR